MEKIKLLVKRVEESELILLALKAIIGSILILVVLKMTSLLEIYKGTFKMIAVFFSFLFIERIIHYILSWKG